MTERVALITGGAKGIGRAIGQSLADDGWGVAFCYRSSAGAASELQRDLERRGARVLAERADVSDHGACAALVERVVGTFGRLDALINCAGPYHRTAIMNETVEGWHEMFDHNLHPVFYLARLCAPHMQKRRWGRIVSFSMANADRMSAQPDITGHYVAKAGILILTRTFAKVLGPHGITVNAISPGFLDSGSAPAEELQKAVKSIPAGYIGTMADAVAATRFLLSEEARYVNGANLQLSGGWGV